MPSSAETNRLNRAQLGFFGGTFDPVHFGHLETARYISNTLSLDQMSLVPSAFPPHRHSPAASAKQRLEMLQLGADAYDELDVDRLELDRVGPSYTVSTLIELRGRLGAQASLYWCVGMDVFCGLTSWHEWRTLFRLAHLIVVTRPGYSVTVPPSLSREMEQRQVALGELNESAFGSIGIIDSPSLSVSATELREALAHNSGEAMKWLPAPVLDYIEKNRLYQ